MVSIHGPPNMWKNWGTKLNKILFPNFFTCSVTPCMLTMTMLPERILGRVHYLAHNRRKVLFALLFWQKKRAKIWTYQWEGGQWLYGIFLLFLLEEFTALWCDSPNGKKGFMTTKILLAFFCYYFFEKVSEICCLCNLFLCSEKLKNNHSKNCIHFMRQ